MYLSFKDKASLTQKGIIMETIKEVRQDIKNKLESINQDDYMVENDLKLVFAPSCGKYRVELTGSVNKVFFAHNLREYKLCLYNFHSLTWILSRHYKNPNTDDVLSVQSVIELLEHCGFYYYC